MPEVKQNIVMQTLIRIEATPDVTVGGITSKWVCR